MYRTRSDVVRSAPAGVNGPFTDEPYVRIVAMRTLLGLATCPNLRDIGGARTLTGRTVRRGLVFRSGSFHLADAADCAAVRAHIRPRTLIDLRTAEEVGLCPTPDGLGARNVLHLPFSTAGAREWMERIGRRSLFDSYVGLARSSGDTIGEIFRVLADPRNHPAIFFCAAGKDRTGIVAALVLSALLVSEQDVIDDYVRTGTIDPTSLGPEYVKRFETLPSEFHASPESAMRDFLASVEEEFGSVRAYLATLGVGVAELTALERSLLTD